MRLDRRVQRVLAGAGVGLRGGEADAAPAAQHVQQHDMVGIGALRRQRYGVVESEPRVRIG